MDRVLVTCRLLTSCRLCGTQLSVGYSRREGLLLAGSAAFFSSKQALFGERNLIVIYHLNCTSLPHADPATIIPSSTYHLFTYTLSSFCIPYIIPYLPPPHHPATSPSTLSPRASIGFYRFEISLKIHITQPVVVSVLSLLPVVLDKAVLMVVYSIIGKRESNYRQTWIGGLGAHPPPPAPSSPPCLSGLLSGAVLVQLFKLSGASPCHMTLT